MIKRKSDQQIKDKIKELIDEDTEILGEVLNSTASKITLLEWVLGERETLDD